MFLSGIMLQAKIVSLPVTGRAGVGDLEPPAQRFNLGFTASPAGASDLLPRVRDIYKYIAQERMIGLAPDLGFDKDGEETIEVPLADGSIMKIQPEAYVSFILFSLLTALTNGRIVLLGDPGLGKTQIAILMGQMMGLPLKDIRAGMVHGHPQLTVADLFGNLDLAEYQKGTIVPVWRDIVKARLRFLDEFNRIPTKTQSALLTAVADNYVELFNAYRQMEDAPWIVTANEANGGGTYQVIAALWDRIDVSARAVPINNHFLAEAEKLDNKKPFPENLTLGKPEAEVIRERIGQLPIDPEAEARLGYFFSQLNACQPAAEAVERRFKSQVGEGGKRGDALWRDAHDDPKEYIGAQVENTVGTRIYFSILRYARALAWFRDKAEVGSEDIRAVLPAVLSHRITPNRSAEAEDRLAWVDKLWQKAMDRYDEKERENGLAYWKLTEELKIIPLEEQPDKIKKNIEEQAQNMDGSAGLEDLLAMKLLYGQVMEEIKAKGLTPKTTEKTSPDNKAAKTAKTSAKKTKGGRAILTPAEVLAMHKAGKTPPIGSLVQLPEGVYQAGNAIAGEGNDDEQPVHGVKISPFCLSAYDVTNAEYGEFIKARGYAEDKYWSAEGKAWRDTNKITQPGNWDDTRFNQANQPVVGVSYYEAEAYLNWLSEVERDKYYLPTRAQFEYAARGGLVGKRYPWGDKDPAGKAHYDQDGSTGKPVEVNAKGFAPNGFGLYHMAGNVWKWLSDWYKKDYYQELKDEKTRTGKVVKDPKGPSSGSSREFGGGSWRGTADCLRAAARDDCGPDCRNGLLGFRAARDSSPLKP